MSSFAFANIDSTCQPIVDANLKTLKTPYYAYSSVSVNGQSYKSEVIFVGGTEYSQTEGNWTADPVSADDLDKRAEAERDVHSTTSCQHVRDESINGETAAVCSSHSTGGDQTLWISKSMGVILRSEVDAGRGAAKTHSSTRYEYSNVQKPKM
jgi:hypothetical protein